VDVFRDIILIMTGAKDMVTGMTEVRDMTGTEDAEKEDKHCASRKPV
jgi:hypothetical protein